MEGGGWREGVGLICTGEARNLGHSGTFWDIGWVTRRWAGERWVRFTPARGWADGGKVTQRRGDTEGEVVFVLRRRIGWGALA
jgi:hypothetical protein